MHEITRAALRVVVLKLNELMVSFMTWCRCFWNKCGWVSASALSWCFEYFNGDLKEEMGLQRLIWFNWRPFNVDLHQELKVSFKQLNLVHFAASLSSDTLWQMYWVTFLLCYGFNHKLMAAARPLFLLSCLLILVACLAKKMGHFSAFSAFLGPHNEKIPWIFPEDSPLWPKKSCDEAQIVHQKLSQKLIPGLRNAIFASSRQKVLMTSAWCDVVRRVTSAWCQHKDVAGWHQHDVIMYGWWCGRDRWQWRGRRPRRQVM